MVLDDEEITVMTTNARKSNGLWRRFVDGFWKRETKMHLGPVTLVFALLGVAGFTISHQFSNISDQAARRARVDTARQLYDQEVHAYDVAVAARTLCADGVGRSDANREQWLRFADFIAALDTGNGKAVAFANDGIRSGPVLSQPPRTMADCPEIPEVPEPPKG